MKAKFYIKNLIGFLSLLVLCVLIAPITSSYADEYSTVPANLTEPAPVEYYHINKKKRDTSGGLVTCIKTSQWIYGAPTPSGICDYGIIPTAENPVASITPTDAQLDDFRGPDVLNPCGALRSKYVNRYWKHDFGAYGDEFCSSLQSMAQLSPQDLNNYNQDQNSFFALLDSIVPDAFAKGFNGNDLPQMKGSCYDKFVELERSPTRLSKSQAENIDLCMAYCDISTPTKKTQNFCGVNKCLADFKSNNTPSEWCCSLALNLQGKFGADKNPLTNIRNQCGVGVSLPICLRQFAASGVAPKECCKFSTIFSKYHKKAGKDITRRCGAYNSAQYCLASHKRYSDKVAKPCCVLNYTYSGKIEDAPKIDRMQKDMLKDLKSDIRESCDGFKVTEDENVKKCVINLKKTRKLSAECCMAYHTGMLNPSAIGASFNRLEKYCYPEKYSRIITKK